MNEYRRRAPGWLAIILAVSAAGCSGSAGTGSSQNISAKTSSASTDSAKKLIERALEAMGSVELIRERGGLAIAATGVMNQGTERQGRRPGTLDPAPFRESFVFDAARDRVAWEYRHERYDGTGEWLRELYDQPGRQLLFILNDRFAVDLRSPEHIANKRKAKRRIPQLLLTEILERSQDLRALGTKDGRQGVEARLSSGETFTIWLDIESGVSSQIDYVTDVQTHGDTRVSWRYAEYRAVPDYGLFPYRYGVWLGNRPFTEMRVDEVSLGPAGAEAMFERPSDIAAPRVHEVPPQTDASRNAKVEQVAPGVYIVKNLRLGFHPMFVELADFVVAIDAPAGYRLLNQIPAGDVAPGPSSSWLSERYLDLIGDALPKKPVRYVVLTHFHNDHAGGLRAFMKRGITIVAAPSDRAAIEALAAAPHTVAPDGYDPAQKPPMIETINGSRVISDGSRNLEILDMGRNPHTDHMLVAHLPAEKIMYVSDLLTPTGDVQRFPLPSHEKLDRAFVAWLDERKLDPEQIFTMHGSGRATREHLSRAR